jgi:hypothetical protein
VNGVDLAKAVSALSKAERALAKANIALAKSNAALVKAETEVKRIRFVLREHLINDHPGKRDTFSHAQQLLADPPHAAPGQEGSATRP